MSDQRENEYQLEIKEYLYYCPNIDKLFISTRHLKELNKSDMRSFLHQALGLEIDLIITYIGEI